MKKCPYCAEDIQNEAIVCRYCKKDLITIQKTDDYTPKEPSDTEGCFMGIFLLLLIYGIAFLIGLLCRGSVGDLEGVLGIYQIIIMFFISLLALSSFDPEKRGIFRFIGIFILSIIPIAGWIVIFWAGKGLARRLK